MPADPSKLDPQKLWQSQPKEFDPMTLAAIHEKARTFQTKVRRRNAIEYVAGAVGMLAFVPAVLQRDSWLMQAGGALIILAMVFILWQLHRRASARTVPEASQSLADFHRGELIRQRDAIRSVGAWYIAPVVPGMALLLIGRWFQSHAPGRSIGIDHLIILLGALIAVLVLLVIWLVNQRGAERLQRRIDAL
ncbi:MAG TPA: hypothetical protein VGF71_04195 [Caulobacteraceae bacterium]|jgi:hypothetical protein